jgi:hypothetical protein
LGIGEIFVVTEVLASGGTDAVLIVNADVDGVGDIRLKAGKGFIYAVDFANFNCGIGA